MVIITFSFEIIYKNGIRYNYLDYLENIVN